MFSHARHLMEDTIRRNASPVRQPGAVPNAGSSSSINSSASDDSMLPASVRSVNPLVHSLSANDAGAGQYKYSVVIGDNVIRIIGDNLDLVKVTTTPTKLETNLSAIWFQVCKLVLDEYFSGENIESLQQFNAYDAVFPESPISPPTSTPSPGLVLNGSGDEPVLGKSKDVAL